VPWAGLLVVVPILLAALSGCGFMSGSKRPPPPAVLFSPNGEPLSGGPLGRLSCPEAVHGWFARTDASHDGAIELNEFLADAAAQFTRMDLDHDGLVSASVLARYRAPYEKREPRDAHAKPGEPGAARTRSVVRADEADPVMAADVQIRFAVTRAEFLAYAKQHFAALAPSGRLTEDELVKACDEP
jgi:hypothetical protein